MRSVRTSLRGLVVVLLVAIAAVPCSASAAARQNRAETAIMKAMNAARAQHGLPALRLNRALARAADAHSAAMLRSGAFTHGPVNARLRRYTRARSVGETLAWLTRCDSRKIVAMWLQSAAHRKIMLARRFHAVGVGRKASSSRCMVTADFAG